MSGLTDLINRLSRQVVKLEAKGRRINSKDTARIDAFEFYTMTARWNYWIPDWTVTVEAEDATLSEHSANTLRAAIDAAIHKAKERNDG